MKPIDVWITALTILLGVLILLLPLPTVILFLSDDAYYYTKVAMNNIAGLGLTFDGINPTNGWHPLWMLLIHPIYWFQLDATISLRLVLILQLAMTFLSLRLVMSISQRLYPNLSPVAPLSALLFFVPVTVLALNGLESALLVLMELLLISTLVSHSEKPDDSRIRIVLGILIGLVFLSRLDTAFMMLALAAAILALDLKKHGSPLKIISDWWLPATVSVALVLPYIVWNITTHEHLTPISGVLKNTFPYPHIRLGFIPRVPHFIAAIILAACWLSYRLYSQPSHSRRYGLLLALTIGCLIHLLWSIVFMAWGTFQWHFVAQAPLIVVALADWLSTFSYKRTITACALILAIAINVGSAGLRLGHHQERLEAAEWLNLNRPNHFRVGLRDAGIFGYFSDHQVVNLDGLINSYDFYEAINQGQVTQFLRQSDVQYLADAYTPCNYQSHQINVVAHDSDDPRTVVGEIRLMQKKDEIASFRTKKLFEKLRLGDTCFVIWQGIGTPYPIVRGTK